MKKRVYAISLALLILAMALQTSFAFAQWTEDDGTYESFGPRIDSLIYRSYPAGVDALMLALEAGEIDFAVWETPAEYVDKWSTSAPYNDPNDPDFMKMVDFSDIGQREMDLNHKERIGGGLDGSYPSTYPDWRSPTSYKEFRQALAHLVNRTYYITEILEGWAVELWSPIMPWTFWFEDACEGAFPTSLADARAKLDSIGFIQGSTGPIVDGGDNVRVYPPGHEKAGEDLDDVLFYIRSDDPFRYQAGLHMATEMEKVGIPVGRKIGTSSYCYFPVFWHQDYHLYTGGWSLSIDPDYIYSLYGGVFIDWPNYLWYNSTAFDAEAGDNLFYATTMAQAEAGCKAAQMIAWGPGGEVCNIPLWTAVAQSTRRGYYNPDELLPDEKSGGPYADMIGKPWEGWVNGEGVGFTSYSTVHPKDFDSGGRLRIGQNQAPIKLNILKSEWYYEYNILLQSYDFLMTVNPYTFDDEGYLAESWDFSWWWDESAPAGQENKTQLIFELDDRIYWHDGVPFTSDDVKFAIEYYRDNLGWWYSNVQDVISVICPDDYTVMVQLDVASVWALHWIGLGVPIFPRHIWEFIPDPTIDMPDPTLTGTGMFDFISYDPDAYVAVFNAFKADIASHPYPNPPIRSMGPPSTSCGTKPTGYKVVTRKTVFALEYCDTLDISDKVKNFMAGATATFTPPPWSGTWTVTTPTTSEGIYTTLVPCDPPTTLIYTPVDMSTWPPFSHNLVHATHDNQVNDFPIDNEKIVVTKTYAGDVNGDTLLNVLDALAMMSALGLLPYGVFTSNCDINCDGQINVLDCLIIVNAFAGPWP